MTTSPSGAPGSKPTFNASEIAATGSEPRQSTPLTQIHHFDPNGIKVEATFQDEPVPTDIVDPPTPPPYDDPPRIPDLRP